MITPKISIIVPVYNVEKYLCQCLESIINQTLTDIEIICINDGSTDYSTQILREYAKKDSRIVLIEKKNAGYGAAMNTGIAHAVGEYIGIVEPDDFIEWNMFQILYETALKHLPKADMIKSGYWEYRKINGKEYTKAAPILNFSPTNNPFTLWEDPSLLYYHPCTVTAIYRREFLREKSIRYIEAPGASWTDNPFFFMTLCQASSIIWVKQCLYYYRQDNFNSSSHLKDCSIPFLRLSEIFDFIDKKQITDPEILKALYKRTFLYLNGVLNNPFYQKKSVHPLILDIMKRMDPKLLKDPDFNRLEKYYYKCFLSGSHVILEHDLFRKIYIRSVPDIIRTVIHSILEYGILHTTKRILHKFKNYLSI